MKRNIDLKEISDGKLYSAQDMVRADCRDCEGCSDCCRGMGESVVLDPLDVCRLTAGTGMDFRALMNGYIELHAVDGLILPNLSMSGDGESCPFLTEAGRCSIHPYRPGICRLFPLGRCYEEKGFRYFLQVHECGKTDRTKIKVKKWIDAGDVKAYETYIWRWHEFLERCREGMQTLDEEKAATLCLYIVRTFFEEAYGLNDLEYSDQAFYEVFYSRLERSEELFGF